MQEPFSAGLLTFSWRQSGFSGAIIKACLIRKRAAIEDTILDSLVSHHDRLQKGIRRVPCNRVGEDAEKLKRDVRVQRNGWLRNRVLYFGGNSAVHFLAVCADSKVLVEGIEQ